jgi:hypothetical protein
MIHWDISHMQMRLQLHKCPLDTKNTRIVQFYLDIDQLGKPVKKL